MIRPALSLCALVFSLAACTLEPNEANLLEAVEAELGDINGMLQNFMGGALGDVKARAVSVKKAGCKEDKPTWICYVDLTLDVPLMGVYTKMQQIKVVKTDAGWRTVK